MITKIKAKTEKETSTGKIITKLCLSILEEDYLKIKEHLAKNKDVSENLIKSTFENEYEGKLSYQFWVIVGRSTFDRVEKFGTLEAKFTFSINEKGYINASITRDPETGKLKVSNYTPPEFASEEWECDVTGLELINNSEKLNSDAGNNIAELLGKKLPKATRIGIPAPVHCEKSESPKLDEYNLTYRDLPF
jgi:hypothetical protein